jgi:hypothetical protein
LFHACDVSAEEGASAGAGRGFAFVGDISDGDGCAFARGGDGDGLADAHGAARNQGDAVL